MTKRPKPKRKSVKRGPKEERSVITADSNAARDKVLDKFYAALRDGMNALESRNFGAMAEALSRQREAVAEQMELFRRKKKG